MLAVRAVEESTPPVGRPPASPQALHAAGELLRALSAPHRLAIVLQLAEGTRCVHDLVASLGISQSLTSQHLRVLRASGLVAAVRRGREMAYSLADAHVAHIARDALTHRSEPTSSAGARPREVPGPCLATRRRDLDDGETGAMATATHDTHAAPDDAHGHLPDCGHDATPHHDRPDHGHRHAAYERHSEER